MDFDSVTLTKILTVCVGEEPRGPEETVALIRQQQPSFALTMYSVWEREGQRLNPALRYELDLQRTRIERYQALSADLARLVPGAVPFKGLQVGALYPANIVRYMNDLDYVATDEAALWQVADVLLDRGWTVESGTFWMHEGRLHPMVAFRKPHEDPYALPYGVEIATYVALGSLAGVPPVVRLPQEWCVAEVKNLVMLLLERFEQRFRARDLLDATLQFDALGQQRYPMLAREIERLGLWPEYVELRALIDRADLGVVPPPAPPGAILMSRARRAGRALAPFRRPAPSLARNLQRRMIYGTLTRPEQRAWAVAGGRLAPGWALCAGLLCFGLPVDGGPVGLSAAFLGERGETAWVDSPVGRFLLTPGDEVTEDALESLPVAAPPPAGIPQDLSTLPGLAEPAG